MAPDMATVICPRCGTRYSAQKECCPNCTLVLPPDEASYTRPLKRLPTLLPQPGSASEELTPDHVVLLQALPSGRCIILPREAAIILGREMDGEPSPHHSLVALDKLGAQRHGVSRLHCLIERRTSGLTVSDLGSTNGTFINEHLLEPHRPYTLVHGDCLTLGTLHLVMFFGALGESPLPSCADSPC
ncbi:MAG: FHA domain-containing protein [Anaerolineae bacterium]|nr:FHA domain-containing protein [Anaerolineae bacterium]